MAEKETTVKTCNLCSRRMVVVGKDKDLFICPKCDGQ